MGMSRAELKARLLAEYEAVVERRLARSGNSDELTLSQIEALALDIGREVEARVSQCLVDEGRTAAVCTACGVEMDNKGLKKRHVQTRSGLVELERVYYYCEHCRRGFFPAG
jgi:hypothetical protein